MNKITPFAAWSYLVITTLLEAALANKVLSLSTTYANIAIGVLAASQVATVGAIYLGLKYEPRAVVGIAVASLFFAVLAVVLALGSLGH